MKTLKKILLWTVVVVALIQLVPIDRTNPPVDRRHNFVSQINTPQNVAEILKNACYDCHSFETKYPGYAYVAPISWSVKHHINEGRDHMNLSVWGTYNRDLKKNILEKAAEAVHEREMPIPGYTVYHREANLTDAQRKLLTNYFEDVLKSGNY